MNISKISLNILYPNTLFIFDVFIHHIRRETRFIIINYCSGFSISKKIIMSLNFKFFSSCKCYHSKVSNFRWICSLEDVRRSLILKTEGRKFINCKCVLSIIFSRGTKVSEEPSLFATSIICPLSSILLNPGNNS